MNLLEQALLVFVLLQLLFGYLEYRIEPDILSIIPKLFSRKYLIPSLIIPPVYIIIVALLGFLLR